MISVPKEIEHQHQKLLNMIDGLNDAVKNHEPLERINRIIDDIISYTTIHFATEEQLMVQYGYPQIEAHKDKHKQLIQEALHLKGKLRHVGEHQFIMWFNHWPFTHIHAHIQYADKQIIDYIIQRNL